MNSNPALSLLTALALGLGLVMLPSAAFADTGDVADTEASAPPAAPVAQVGLPAVTDGLVMSPTQNSQPLAQQQNLIFYDAGDDPHWMWLVARNAVWGGMLGGLIGFGAYLVTGLQWDPWIIAHFAGGGILVGAATGVIEAAFWSGDDDDTRASVSGDAPASVHWVTQDMPQTWSVGLFNVEF